MARARSLNIYGIDENAYAHRVSTEALGAPNENSFSGAPTGEEGSKGNTPPNDKSEVKVTHDKGDGRAKSCGNHGCND